MRYALPAAAAAMLLAAVPAQATQGLLCRPVSGDKPLLSLVLGAGGIAGAYLDEKSGWISTMAPEAPLLLAQAWIDREQVLARIVDHRWEPVAELRARFEPAQPRQPTRATGTLVLRGRAIRVRCEED